MYGLDIAKKIIEDNITNRPVLIYGDPDVDGLMALLLACQFCDTKGVSYTYFVNEKRKHGFTLNPAVLKGYFIIAVDFDITEQEMKILVQNDIRIVSFDHHEVQTDFINIDNKGVVINNQYPFEPEDNRYQSGTGVFYEAICEMYPDFASEERKAIVGITLLSDARPIENDKAKGYLRTTYGMDAQTGYFGYLVENVLGKDFTFGVPRMDRDFIDYTFSPKVNSLLRFGFVDEAVNFILGKGLTINNTKERQSELISAMKENSSVLDLPNIKVVGVDEADFPNVDLTSFIGLLCSDVKGTGKSVLGFVFRNGIVTRASFRGQYDDVEYRKGFQKLDINAQGHAGAFGIVDFQPTEQTWVQLDKLIGELNQGHKMSATIVDANNLSFILIQRGLKIATDNCFVRDMYRTYIRYTGNNAKINKISYKSVALTSEEINNGVSADCNVKGRPHKYLRDNKGNLIPKYIEYYIDGKYVKSFGVSVEEGLILPILEKGHVHLYIRERVD